MSDPLSSDAIERLLTRLRRLVRLRELRAPTDIVDNEIALVRDAWRAVAADEQALPIDWPPELEAVAVELRMRGASPGAIDSHLGVLGDSPSELSTEDPGALVQRSTGYEITDHAAIFGRRGSFLAGGLPGATLVRPPPAVEFAGTLFVISGRLCTFDPLDSVWLDRTVQELDREVPRGEHRVYVARWDDAPAAAVVLFGSNPVRGWAPARLDADRNPMPVPPMLPMSRVRYALGLADRSRFEEMMDLSELPKHLEGINGLRASRGEPPLGPDDALPRAIREQVPLTLLELRRSLSKECMHRIVEDVLAVRTDDSVVSHWGLDERGAVVALALDFGHLRLFPNNGNGGEGVSRPAVVLDPASVARRLRRHDPTATSIDVDAEARRLVGLFLAWRSTGQTALLARELGRLGCEPR